MKIASLKKNYKAVLIIAASCGLFFSSCKKYFDLTPTSGFTPNYVFDNVSDAQKAVWGVYQELSGDYGYGLNLSLYYTVDNDEMMGPGGSSGFGDGGKKDITHYIVNSGTNPTVLANPYNQLYEGIERANNCIKYIPLMPDYTSSSDSAELHRLYGESLTLRAQFYFDLVKIWGDVPAQFVPSADNPNLFLPNSDRDSIYDHILDDLQIAETVVPYSNQVIPNGRLSQNAIRGLRARIALFRGGFSLRNVGGTGVMQRGSNWQTYYQIAKSECDAVIANGGNHLNPSFQSIFQNYLDKGINEPNEVLFQVGSAPGYAVNGDSKLGLYDGPKSTINGTSSSGGILVLPTYFYLFDSTDTRRDVTCAPYTIGSGATASGLLLTAQKITAIYDGKDRRDWAANPSQTGQYLSENWPIIRYSDILLMDAEADNELNGQASVTDTSYLYMVKLRGHGGTYNWSGTIPMDHDNFFRAIMNERSLEFGGEGLRKYDLIRWDSLDARIAETEVNLTNMTNETGFYNGYDLSTLPTSMYWTNDANGNVVWLNSFYYQSNPGSGTKISWIGSGIGGTFFSSGITSPGPYAKGFTPNVSELFPFHATILTSDPSMHQNPGYN